MSEYKRLANELAKPPTKEEWELRQRADIVQRWRRIADDLDAMVRNGTIDNGMTVSALIVELNKLGIKDVR